MAAECEIDSCGVLAIGRCVDCGTAFCQSHQGIGLGGGGFTIVDLCVLCKQKRDHDAYVQSDRPSKGYVTRNAKAELRAAQVPTEELHRIGRYQRPRRIGRSKVVNVVLPEGRGWVIGEMIWSLGEERVPRPYLTMLLDDDGPFGQPYMVEHDHEHGGFIKRSSGNMPTNGWRDAAAAIRSLISRDAS
jgi:hypothetical protein